MTLRCSSWGEYLTRILFLVLLCLAVHSVRLVILKDREDMFAFWRPDRLRSFVVMAAVVGIAAGVMYPKKGGRPTAEKAAGAAAEAPPPAALPQEPPTEQPVSEPPAAPSEEVPSAHETETPPAEPKPEVPRIPPSLPPSRPPVERAGTVAVSATDVEAAPPSRYQDQVFDAYVNARRRAARGGGAARPTDDRSSRRLWERARDMPHNYIPDLEHDYMYLTMVYAAATAGRVEAQAKLGEYALRREAYVEAYYWLRLAAVNGMRTESHRELMRECCTQWVLNGCDPEYGNEYRFFSGRQGTMARAMLRHDTGIDVRKGRERLREMAMSGDETAAKFLSAIRKESEEARQEERQTSA